MLRSIGADHVIDYTMENYTDNGETYDLIIDVVGKNSVISRLKLLKKYGYYFLAYAGLSHIVLGMWVSLTSSKKLKIESARQTQADLLFLKELIESGEIISVIDRHYSMEQTAEAHRYVETGYKQGNVVITVVHT